MANERKHNARLDRILWYLMIVGGLCIVAPLLPLVPWRFSRTDTNVGNRFVTDRYYSLWGATDQFGKTVNWFALRNKIQQKNQELAKPSPLGVLAGAVNTGMATGGAALGCANWQACKEHVMTRYRSYDYVAKVSVGCFISLVLGFFFCLGSVALLSMERVHEHGKKKEKSKKKKHHDDDDEDEYDPITMLFNLTPQAKTMVCTICAFIFSFGGLVVFQTVMDITLKDFQKTAYYPYAMSHVGPYLSGFGSFFILVAAVITINKHTPFSSWFKHEEEQDTAAPLADAGAQGGYPPEAHGGEGYPPSMIQGEPYPQPSYGYEQPTAGAAW